MDRRAPRSLDVFAPRNRCASAGSGRGRSNGGSGGGFRAVQVGICSREPKQGRFPFQWVPVTRLFVLWAATAPGGERDRTYSPMLASLPLLLWKTPPGLELILAQEGVPFETVKDPHPYSFRGGRFVLFDGRAATAGSTPAAAEPGSCHDRRRRAPARRAGRPFRGARRSPAGDRLVGRWRFTLSERVARYAQGLDSPAADRQLARRGHRRRGASGSGWPRFRTRIARPSASAPTSMNRCPRTTTASPRPGRARTGAARILSARTPIRIIHRCSPI